MENITEKVKNNAIASYLLIFVNILFLFNKNKININNDFVKNHTKTAILIHLWFLINTIIFVNYWLWFHQEIMWYNISDIIAITIYLILFSLLIIWAYKAYNKEVFKIWETIDLKKDGKLLDITDNWKFSEKDKLTILLSLIPFVGFSLYPEYQKNKLIENNTKLNLIITFIISILYILWNPNLASLLLLIYVIFIVFSWINLFIQNKVTNINLEKIPTPTDKLNYLKALKKYLWNYFWNKKEFPSFSVILKNTKTEEMKVNNSEEKKLNAKNNFKLNNIFIYIPIINLISLFNTNVKQQKHIINWIIISMFFIIILILNHFIWFDNKYLLLLLFPICFWYWYLKAWVMDYEIPFLYIIFILFNWIKNKIKSIFIKVKKIKNTNTVVNLKVWENSKNTYIKDTKKIV